MENEKDKGYRRRLVDDCVCLVCVCVCVRVRVCKGTRVLLAHSSLCLGLIPQSCPQEKGSHSPCLQRAPQAWPLIMYGPSPYNWQGPSGHQAPATEKKSHKPHLHLIWLSFMVDSWPSELLLGDRLDKPSDWHTNLLITFFFSWKTQIPSVSPKESDFHQQVLFENSWSSLTFAV